MKNSATSSSTTAFLSGWITRFGLPEHFTSDRGTCFTSRLQQFLAEDLRTTAHHTTSCNPAANSMVERTHCSLKASLVARCNNEMVLDQPLVVPDKFFHPQNFSVSLQQLQRTFRKFPPCVQTHDREVKEYLQKHLHNSTLVFQRTNAHIPPLTCPYTGPNLVLARKDKTFRISISGRPEWVSINRLQPAYLDIPPTKFSLASSLRYQEHMNTDANRTKKYYNESSHVTFNPTIPTPRSISRYTTKPQKHALSYVGMIFMAL
ncbi:uncharacterized protein LOC143034272 [Oratosquilla oratoria]|uniref:uncharacterized protein LOC143034272 n=1 Tax=Oratosquilla oratoria TaxID=337810 RepID=UPI003F769E02